MKNKAKGRERKKSKEIPVWYCGFYKNSSPLHTYLQRQTLQFFILTVNVLKMQAFATNMTVIPIWL